MNLINKSPKCGERAVEGRQLNNEPDLINMCGNGLVK